MEQIADKEQEKTKCTSEKMGRAGAHFAEISIWPLCKNGRGEESIAKRKYHWHQEFLLFPGRGGDNATSKHCRSAYSTIRSVVTEQFVHRSKKSEIAAHLRHGSSSRTCTSFLNRADPSDMDVARLPVAG